MKKSDFLSKFLFATSLLALLIFAVANQTLAQKSAERPNPAGDDAVAALSSGLFSLLPGQSVRVAAVNVGGKAINGQFLFVPVSEQGKAAVPIRCNWNPAPGDAAFDKFTHPGGVNRILMYVQIRVFEQAKDLEKLAPSLEIYNEQTGETVDLLSGSDFVSLRPIYIPPFAPEN